MEKELTFIQEVAKEVDKKGGKVYFVGGYVRDKFLNKENKDIDVEVYGLTMLQLKDLLSKFGEVIEVGATFGILMVKGYDIDFALPRTENSTGSKHTDFDVVVNAELSLEDATKRRDFTMNAILQDVLTGKYIDLYGGIADIKAKKIRYVDEATFKEDELRIFRACQFASRFNFSIDNKVNVVARDMNFTTLSKERIYEELNKALLKSDKPSIAFNSLYDMGVVTKLFPELEDLKGCTQSEVHHPEGDAWSHTMMVLDECARLRRDTKYPLGLMYAGLCHDLGKPRTRVESEGGKITFYDHENVGITIAETFLKRLTNETKMLNYVLNMTEYHMHGHRIMEFKNATLRKLMTKVDIEELMLFAEADSLGRGGIQYVDYTKEREDNINRVAELSMGSFGKIEPYFKGSDLIAMGFKQGKDLGKALDEAYVSQLNGVAKGKIESMLMNKITPKKKDKGVGSLVDEEVRNIIRNDRQVYQSANKRLTMFKYYQSMQENKGIKFRQTPKKIPYVEIVKEDKKGKYLITPLFVMEMDLHNKNRVILFTTADDKIAERQRIFPHILETIDHNRADKMRFMLDVYGRLPNKVGKNAE